MFNSSLIGDLQSFRSISSFSQTCALLSRYVKENKAFGDLSFDMAAEIDGRVNEIAEEVPKKDKSVSSAEYIPDSSGIKSAPLTIFYDGQVIVMMEIMQLANDNFIHNRINLSMSKNMLDLNPTVQELAPETIISDLPQKRRAYLQRFMGKRKERRSGCVRASRFLNLCFRSSWKVFLPIFVSISSIGCHFYFHGNLNSILIGHIYILLEDHGSGEVRMSG